jgi:ribosome biogenesis GTPase / thiamine phosphate phosphatase
MTGIVVKSYGKFYTVEYESGRINCVLRGRLRKDKRLEQYSEAVAVGDSVEFEPDTDGTGGSISLVRERRNVFTRKYKESDRDDLIAANLDRIVVIQCFGKPRLNLRFVDRLLVRGCREEIPVTLCVNKLDLAGEDDAAMLHDYYRGYDADIMLASAKTGEGLDALREKLAGALSILIGSSGVGKSSILNGLYPGLDLRTTEVSESTGKGRHTTTNVEMFTMADGARIIDTPGLREFGLVDIEPEELGVYFMEFGAYSRKCGFSPCTHDHEPDCEVKKRVEKGKLSEERYISYLNILYTLKENYQNRYR